MNFLYFIAISFAVCCIVIIADLMIVKKSE
jgi:hypothetical protein